MRLFPKRRLPQDSDQPGWVFWRWFDIWKGGEIYLTRLVLFRCPWFQVLLHWIRATDDDPGPHDHPWSFFSLLLWGSYTELVGQPDNVGWRTVWLEKVKLQRCRWLNSKGTRSAHQIVRLHSRTVLSLVVSGPKRKSWGFYVPRSPLLLFKEPPGSAVVDYVEWREALTK